MLHAIIGTLLLIPSAYLLGWGAYLTFTGHGPKGRATRDWRNRPIPRASALDRHGWQLNGVGLIVGGSIFLLAALRALVE